MSRNYVIAQKKSAYACLSSEDFANGLQPEIVEKLKVVEASICEHDEGDVENRGFRKALKWMLSRRETLRRELEKEGVFSAQDVDTL